MEVDGLHIPELLLTMVDAGRWPRSAQEAMKQNNIPLASPDRVRLLAPGERAIYLYPPPFGTVARYLQRTEETRFYREFGAVDQLVPEAAIEIGDFGMGSDAPIVLDYRHSKTDPTVIRLRWPGDGKPNHWVFMAESFESFVEALGL